MIKIKFLIILGFLLLGSSSLYSCKQKKHKTEEKKMTTNISWTFGLTAPKGYPIEVQGGGYLADDKKMISAIFNNGILDDGWDGTGSPTKAGGGSVIPNHLSLTWLSLAEKKFWKIDASLPADKIFTLFSNGYTDKDRKGIIYHATYEYLTVGLAPGGVVVLWVSGRNSTVEVGRFKAKEAKVDVGEAAPVAGAYKNEKEFVDERFKDGITKEAQENIKENGIPYGLWDSYRQPYNWRFIVQFYKPDSEQERHCVYLDGSQEVLKGELLTKYRVKPLPYRIDFYFKDDKWAETEFDGVEVMNAFKTLTQNDKNIQVEIIGKVAFQYKGMSFVVKAGKQEIPLRKVSVR